MSPSRSHAVQLHTRPARRGGTGWGKLLKAALLAALLPALAVAQVGSGKQIITDVGALPATINGVRTTVAKHTAGWVSVKDYGALGDGVTDDTATLNALLAALGTTPATLVVPGPVKVTGNITIPATLPVRFEGAGAFIGQGHVSYTPWAAASVLDPLSSGVSLVGSMTAGAYASGAKGIIASRLVTAPYYDTVPSLQTAPVNQFRYGASTSGGPQGLIVTPGNPNLVPSPNDLTGTRWAPTAGIAITANNLTAPDGSITGSKVAKTDTTSGRNISFQFWTPSELLTAGQTYTIALSLIGGSSTQAQFGVYSGGFLAWTAAIISGPGSLSGASGGAGSAPSITGLSTTQWTRISYTFTGATGASLLIYPDGSASTTNGAWVGVWRVKAEQSATPTDADRVTLAQPLSLANSDFCIEANVAPANAAAWKGLHNNDLIWRVGTEASTNAAAMSVSTTSPSGGSSAGTLQCDLFAADGTYTRSELDLGSFQGPDIPSAGSQHRVSYVYEHGVPRLFLDGVQYDHQAYSEGKAWSAQPSGLQLASQANDQSWPSVFGSFSIWSKPYPNTGKPRYDILYLGDSVAMNPRVWQAISSNLSAIGYQETHSVGAYGGNNMGAGFLDLSDRVYAYESGQWVAKARWKALSAYSAVSFDYLRNEYAYMSVAAYRRAYDKIVALATAAVPRTIMGSCPPLNNGTVYQAGTDGAAAYYAVLTSLAAKWNVPFNDLWAVFPAQVASGAYTVAQLARDTVHPTQGLGQAGTAVMTNTLWPMLLQTVSPTAATPEIAGDVVTYLWGQPTAGAWAQTLLPAPAAITSGGSVESPLYRVARVPDQANVVSATGATLSFPSAKFAMMYVHTISDNSTPGGTFNVVVDGTPYSFATMDSVGRNYPHSFFVVDGLDNTVSHTVSVVTTNALPVRIVGVSYVGVMP